MYWISSYQKGRAGPREPEQQYLTRRGGKYCVVGIGTPCNKRLGTRPAAGRCARSLCMVPAAMITLLSGTPPTNRTCARLVHEAPVQARNSRAKNRSAPSELVERLSSVSGSSDADIRCAVRHCSFFILKATVHVTSRARPAPTKRQPKRPRRD